MKRILESILRREELPDWRSMGVEDPSTAVTVLIELIPPSRASEHQRCCELIADAVLLQAGREHASGQTARAIEMLRNAADSEKLLVGPRVRLYSRLLELGRFRCDVRVLFRWGRFIIRHALKTGRKDLWFDAISQIAGPLDFAGYPKVALRYLDCAAAISDDPEVAAILHGHRLNRGGVLSSLGRDDEAETELEGAARLARQRGDLAIATKALINLGNLLHRQGSWDQSCNVFRDAIDMAAVLQDKSLEFPPLSGLGASLAQKGQLREALLAHEESLQLALELDDARKTGIALHNLSSVNHDLDMESTSLAYLERAIAIERQHEDHPGLCLSLANYACRLSSYGHQSNAFQALAEARTMAERRGLVREHLAIERAEAQVRADVGDLERAEKILETCIYTGTETEQFSEVLKARTERVHLLYKLGRHGEVIQEAEDLQKTYEELNATRRISYFLLLTSWIFSLDALGRSEEAMFLSRDALDLVESLGFRRYRQASILTKVSALDLFVQRNTGDGIVKPSH